MCHSCQRLVICPLVAVIFIVCTSGQIDPFAFTFQQARIPQQLSATGTSTQCGQQPLPQEPSTQQRSTQEQVCCCSVHCWLYRVPHKSQYFSGVCGDAVLYQKAHSQTIGEMAWQWYSTYVRACMPHDWLSWSLFQSCAITVEQICLTVRLHLTEANSGRRKGGLLSHWMKKLSHCTAYKLVLRSTCPTTF